MYTPPAFREDDPALLQAIINRARLSLLVSNGPAGVPLVTHLPLLCREGRVIGHLARANPHWRQMAPRALAIFQGVEGYISPSSYPSKAEHHRVVPTWNYEAVHAEGPVEIVEDPTRLREIVAALTDHHEAGRPSPWSVADAPADYLAAQLKGIVGVVLTIEKLSGKRKLSQNRSAADREGAAAALAASADLRDRALARAMREAAGHGA
ncbi:MAG: FMN-binding negative transcriptional regulator [Rhodovarius sp.]|nr:FMN-binding negative transcriptional regulator [Rhodovarius sp.]